MTLNITEYLSLFCDRVFWNWIKPGNDQINLLILIQIHKIPEEKEVERLALALVQQVLKMITFVFSSEANRKWNSFSSRLIFMLRRKRQYTEIFHQAAEDVSVFVMKCLFRWPELDSDRIPSVWDYICRVRISSLTAPLPDKLLRFSGRSCKEPQ